jgi:hypothetical protein
VRHPGGEGAVRRRTPPGISIDGIGGYSFISITWFVIISLVIFINCIQTFKFNSLHPAIALHEAVGDEVLVLAPHAGVPHLRNLIEMFCL